MTHTRTSAVVGTAALVVLLLIPAAPVPALPPGGAPAEAPAVIGGTVVETMDAGGYTYVQLDAGGKTLWAAGPPTKVAVGDRVTVVDAMPMRDFPSKTLNRTFDVIYFASAITVAAAPGLDEVAVAHRKAGVAPHPTDHGAAAAVPVPAIDLSNITKADGGQTVAELFANKTALAGKAVAVRGRVVKATPNVMGKNWLHLRDGSGGAGTNDLTVSTSASATVGNLVVVRGILATDRDIGAGYRYEVLIEDATVTVE